VKTIGVTENDQERPSSHQDQEAITLCEQILTSQYRLLGSVATSPSKRSEPKAKIGLGDFTIVAVIDIPAIKNGLIG
jgi:hypothetical protein